MKTQSSKVLAGFLMLAGGFLYIPTALRYFPKTTYLKNQLSYSGINSFHEIFLYLSILLPLAIAFAAIFSGILSLISANKFAFIMAFTPSVIWILEFFTTLFWYKTSGTFSFTSIFLLIRDIFLGKLNVLIIFAEPSFSVNYLSILSLLCMGASALLLFLQVKKVSPAHGVPVRTTSVQHLPQVMTQNPNGSKQCPECAELIQAAAVKCRFCGYRYN